MRLNCEKRTSDQSIYYLSVMLLRSLGILFLTTTFSCSAQQMARQLVAVTGSSSTSDGFSIQQSVGEAVISKTLVGSQARIQQGFLHAGFLKKQAVDFSASLFPNPGNGLFTIDTNLPGDNFIRIIVSDASGKVVREGDILSGSSFNAHSISPGTYFISVSARDQQIVFPYIVAP